MSVRDFFAMFFFSHIFGSICYIYIFFFVLAAKSSSRSLLVRRSVGPSVRPSDGDVYTTAVGEMVVTFRRPDLHRKRFVS